MKFRASPMLGLVFSDGAILCAQVAGGARGIVVQKVGRFTPTADATGDGTQQGAALGTFLREHGFTASRAVIGVPARWLLSQEKELPPTGDEEAKAILRLHAERMTMADNAPMVADFTGSFSASTASRVLLVAMLRTHLDQVTRTAEAAGLSIAAVTSTALATARYLNAASESPLVLLSDRGAELVVPRDGAPRTLRHVAFATRGPGGLAAASAELRRALAMAGGAGTGVMLWDGAGLAGPESRELAERLKVDVRSQPTIASLGATVEQTALNGAAVGRPAEAYLPAIALAGAGLDRSRLPVDFASPRLAPVVQGRFGRRTVWAIAIAVLSIVGLATLYTMVQQREAEAVMLNTQLTTLEADVKAAKANIERVSYGRTFFEARPDALACLREVTLAFDYDEPIWTTAFNLRSNGKGQIQGKATNQQIVLTVTDRLRANPHFANVQQDDLREAGGSSGGQEVTFTISFTYLGDE
ncbi:MAG TPA: hypothetical protein VGN72_08295 [Tepidisphaeraceae bacterium]|jgi:hypothetical protein|nr:hypothetical protein [Tepidisphaeraceae bacterium]